MDKAKRLEEIQSRLREITALGATAQAENLAEAEKLLEESKGLRAELSHEDRFRRIQTQADELHQWSQTPQRVPITVTATSPAAEAARLPAIPRFDGKVKSFKRDATRSAEEKAYRFGMWFGAAVLRRAECRSFCGTHGIQLAPVDQSGKPINLALSENVNISGGFLVPDEFRSDMIDLREQYGVFRRNADVWPMMRDTISVPRRTGGVTAYFVGEGATITASQPSWDQVRLTAQKLAARTVLSSELAEDAYINVGDWVANEIAYAFANKEDEAGFNGDGTSTYGNIVGVRQKLLDVDGTIANIKGLFVGSGNAYAELVVGDFVGTMSLLPRYAIQASDVKWYMSQKFYHNVAVREALESGGVTMAEVIQGQREPRYLGYPVEITQVMPTTEANSQICALFGSLRLAAAFGDRRQESIGMSEHAEWNTDQLSIRGTQRFDINVHDVGDTTNAGPIVGLITAAS